MVKGQAMKKIVIIASLVSVLALGLCSCAKAEFGVESDGTSVHAEAIGGADGSATGSIKVDEGYGICINHIVEKGSFHVKVTDEGGNIVFDNDIDDNIANFIDVEPDEYDVVATAKNAVGTLDIIACDKRIQADADAALPDNIREMAGMEKNGS